MSILAVLLGKVDFLADYSPGENFDSPRANTRFPKACLATSSLVVETAGYRNFSWTLVLVKTPTVPRLIPLFPVGALERLWLAQPSESHTVGKPQINYGSFRLM